MALKEQADGKHGWARGYHKSLKVSKRRIERHRAKQNPEAQPAYGKYAGYET